MKNFNFFEKLWEHSRTLRRVGLVLVMCLITITQAWAVNSTFTKGETIFFYSEGTSSAWRDGACVKADFSNNGSSTTQVTTAWLCNATDNENYKVFWAIVPSTDKNRVHLHRYKSDCSTDWSQDGNDINQSGRSKDSYNVIYSAAYNNSGWKNETFAFKLKTDKNSWGDPVATFEDKGDGFFQCSYTFTAGASSHSFKVLDSWGHWYGRQSDGGNYELTGLKSGTTYTVVASFNIKDCASANKTSLSVFIPHTPGTYTSASGYNQTLTTFDSKKYERYGIYKNSSANTFVANGSSSSPASAQSVFTFNKGTQKSGLWIDAYVVANTSSGVTWGTNEFSGFPTSSTHAVQTKEGYFMQFCVQGYEQFNFFAVDKNTSTGYYVVVIDGKDVTTGQSTTAGKRSYTISGGDTHIIKVGCIGSNGANFWGFSLRPAAPSITASSLSGATYYQGDASTNLSVTASPVVTGSTLTYQWYSNTTASNSGGTEVDGATSATFAPPTTSIGTTYYYCVISESGCNTTTSSVSGAITVNAAVCAAPTGLSAGSLTAKGVTLTVEDVANTNDYEFYVSTASTDPVAGTTATHSSNTKSITITNLYAGTTFYAWARAKCGSNKSAWTALTGSTFTTSTVSVTHTLTNVTKTSGATTAGGSDYTAVFSANTDYSMPNPTVTIGGNAATSGTHYTWSVEGAVGTITIPANKINGNIAITLNSVPSAPSSAVISGTYHYFPGDNISLTCTPSGNNGPTTYQWYKGGKADGNRIAGATSPTYTKNSCAFEDAGSYYCKVTCNATSIWAVTNSHENYDVKILRLYVNGSKGGEHVEYVDFVKKNATTATASISLGSNWTYGFNIADGCGHYYGNNGTMQYNNCTNWTTNVSGTDCGLTTTNAATYIFTINYSNLSSITTSVTFPVVNQAAGKVIYFDNNVLKWTGSSIYYRIGHSSHSQADRLFLVPGTANLYKMTTREYNGFYAWQIGNAEGGNGSGKSIYNTKNTPAITASIAYEGASVTADAVTVTPGVDHSKGGDAQNNNCEFYSKTITDGMKRDRVTITAPVNGTITVNYTSEEDVASSFSATTVDMYQDLAHTVILTSITAVADEGYDASAITINGGAYSTNYVVTGNTTIAASFTLKTYTISYNKGTNGTGSKASETKTHGVNFTLPGSTFTYGGHAQDGWSTSDGGALAYALSGSYTTNAAQEFFPHWKCNTPTITDNGDNTVSITVPSGTTVRYTTDGTDPSSSTGTVYSTTFSIAADCTVKAIAYQSNCTDSEIASQACDYTAPANFQMIADASAGSNATVSHNESLAQGSKNCSVLTGGTAKYVALDASTVMTVNKNNSNGQYGWYIQSSQSIVITLSSHMLQAGSVIYVQGNAASNNGITINGSTVLKNNTGAQGIYTDSYTVVAGDTHLVGKNVITITRSGDSRLQEIAISNCASGTPCVTPVLPSLTTPNQACTTGDFAAWDASVTNSAAISAASGSQAVSYSWKNSSSVEVATTASYTPSAAGTYTVTATVHSDASGYIDATATSSTLTASLYTATSIGTQPTTAVAAEEGENFTLGTGMVATGQGDLSYQWYSYTSSGGAGEASIGSATSATYTTSKAAAGTYYYKVKVTADCGTVASNMITVTVTEAPCFKFTCSSQSSGVSAISSGSAITTSSWEDGKATLTGGTMKNSSAGSLNVNKSYGLVMESGKEVTVTLGGDNVLAVGSVITLKAGVSDASGSQTSGLVVSGNTCSPASYTSSTAGAAFTQTYTVTALDGLAGTKSFTIAMKSDLTKTYLNGITVTGCVECTPITPSLSYSKTTLWVNDGDTSTPTLDKGESTGSVTYSSSNTDIATVNESTGVVTAVAGGNVTITASIAADGTHCANTATCNLTIKHADCSGKVIVGVTATGSSAGTLEGLLKSTASGGYSVNLGSNTADAVTYDGYKIDKKKYMYVALSSGNYFQDGDTVHVGIAKLSDIGSASGLYIYAGGKVKGDCVGYKLNANLTANATTAADNIIILSNVPANTDTITIYRTDNQNAFIKYMKVNRFICTDCLGFVDATENGNWNTAGNWIGSTGVSASVPTISDRVHIYKPVTVDINNAKASSVYIYTNSTNTGKVTIDAGKALIIAGKLAKSSDGTNYTNTAAADVIINSTRAAGTGALVMGSHDGTNAATVNFETRAKRDGSGNWINQFVGSPFSNCAPYVDYAIQMYAFAPRGNGDHGGWWSTVNSGSTLTPFIGYTILYNSADELDVTWTGSLNATNDITLNGSNTNLYYSANPTDNLLANSWMAPIHMDEFDEDDFTNIEKTIYIFNSGSPQDYEKAEATSSLSSNTSTAAGTYVSIPVLSSPWIEGMPKVIPAMQGFAVLATGSSPSLKLEYDKLVYTPALTSVGIIPNRAPKRAAAEDAPEVITLRVQGENGWAANAYVLGREDFTNGFDDGWDGRFMEGEETAPQLYAPTPDGEMMVNCVPEIEGTVMAFHAGSLDNSYTCTFVYNGGEIWYLNDLKEEKSTLISNETSYPFVSVAGDKAARFVISKTPINKIVTDIDEANGEKDAKVRKLLIDDHIYIIRGGKMYTADGALVK